MDNQRPTDIPPELRHLIHLNDAYRVLICQHHECRKAIRPRAFSEHLRVQHQTPLRDRERVQEYVSTFSWDYDFSTIQLPRAGSRPQPIIPVVDGFQCQTCPFKSGTRKSMKVHGNKEHKQQRVGDDELFKKVRLQSWFRDHRQRYWVVDENKTRDSSITSTNEGGGVVENTVVVEAREEVLGEEGFGGVVVIDDDDEEFFSGDEDYRESSEGGVSDDEEGGDSSVVEVNESDDGVGGESSTGVDEGGRGSGTQSSDKRRSSPVTEDDEEEIAIIRARRVRKRKVPPTLEDRRGIGIDSEDDAYPQSNVRFRQ